MYRFFVELKNNDKFILSKEILDHIKTIRLKKNEKFYCIYKEQYYLCHLENKEAIIEEELNINNEYENNIVLFASIINIKRFEWLIQKATELGVKVLYPLITKNTNIKYIQQFENKLNRFQTIVLNASQQSFRNSLMKIEKPIKFEQAIKINVKNKYIAHEINKENDVYNELFEQNVAFFIGPEGGFSQEEIEQAIKENIKPVYLGKRILRSETAALFLLSRIKQ
ncbi:MAG: 16S rRNA (uracil(1498)-N(3))-methyltransferase [Mycoplasmataceae bacterium]|nr:16S rRNA (uracil(1498)-N(3))-methyltransferase [Mycoplasmataceae bacterium]